MVYNPKDPALKSGLIEENELAYLKSLLKGNTAKFESEQFCEEMYNKAAQTAKFLTDELVEGKNPVSVLLAEYGKKRDL